MVFNFPRRIREDFTEEVGFELDFTSLLGFHWLVREENGILGRGSIMWSEAWKYIACLGEMAKNVVRLKYKIWSKEKI